MEKKGNVIFKGTTKKQELTFVASGFCGICLYYLLENIALTYTLSVYIGEVKLKRCFFLKRKISQSDRGRECVMILSLFTARIENKIKISLLNSKKLKQYSLGNVFIKVTNQIIFKYPLI